MNSNSTFPCLSDKTSKTLRGKTSKKVSRKVKRKCYDSIYDILSKCPRKEINHVPNCPSIRACPHCREGIEHTDGCNSMQCSSCGKNFCFICLDTQCKTPHVPAPVQTVGSV